MNATIERRYIDGSETRYDVSVPTERGDKCVISVGRERVCDVWELRFSGELLRLAPEALTAAVQMALLALRADMAASEDRT